MSTSNGTGWILMSHECACTDAENIGDTVSVPGYCWNIDVGEKYSKFYGFLRFSVFI